MCLPLPVELIAIEDGHPPGVAVDPLRIRLMRALALLWWWNFGGVPAPGEPACVPEARLGDQLLVHVRLALRWCSMSTASHRRPTKAVAPAFAYRLNEVDGDRPITPATRWAKWAAPGPRRRPTFGAAVRR